MVYFTEGTQQREYSKKKLPELHQRYNDMEARHKEEKEVLLAKIERHQSIVGDDNA